MARVHPFEGSTNPFALVCLRSNCDVQAMDRVISLAPGADAGLRRELVDFLKGRPRQAATVAELRASLGISEDGTGDLEAQERLAAMEDLAERWHEGELEYADEESGRATKRASIKERL